jgi:hypothetical protein
MKKPTNAEIFIPIVASSLLNATYSRMLITKPATLDDQIFQKEASVVFQQWGLLRQLVENDWMKKETTRLHTLQNATQIYSTELNKVQSRLADIAKLPQDASVQAEKKTLDEKLQVLLVLGDRFQI